jgi:hypothetical protein
LSPSSDGNVDIDISVRFLDVPFNLKAELHLRNQKCKECRQLQQPKYPCALFEALAENNGNNFEFEFQVEDNHRWMEDGEHFCVKNWDLVPFNIRFKCKLKSLSFSRSSKTRRLWMITIDKKSKIYKMRDPNFRKDASKDQIHALKRGTHIYLLLLS